MRFTALILMVLFSGSHFSFGQRSYHNSFDISFEGGNNGGFSGNMAADVVCSINSPEGVLNVAVNKINAPWSVLWWYFASCWTKVLYLDQDNRYIEFRVKCDKAQLTPMSVNQWGGCDGCCSEKKTWPGNTFIIPEANTWTTVFLKVPPTTGGSQNILDTSYSAWAWGLENGNYSFDYIKMGYAAVPPKISVNPVKTINVGDLSGPQIQTISGISLPGGRFPDGITIEAVSLSNNLFKDLKFIDPGTGIITNDPTTKTAEAYLQFTINKNMGGSGDSIIITLKDTIRQTETKTSFYVNVLDCNCSGLVNEENSVSLFPSVASDMITIISTEPVNGRYDIVDETGRIRLSGTLNNCSRTSVDISGMPAGLHFVRIQDGSDSIIKKFIKN